MLTKSMWTFVFTIVAALSFSAPASAQEVTRMPDASRRSVGVDAGVEAAFVARATYVHRLELGSSDARLFGRLTMPFVMPDLGDFGVDGGMRVTPIAWRDLRLSLLAGPLLRNASNRMFSATALGVEVTMLLGYEGLRWGLSAQAGYQQLLTTHLRHSDVYRELPLRGREGRLVRDERQHGARGAPRRRPLRRDRDRPQGRPRRDRQAACDRPAVLRHARRSVRLLRQHRPAHARKADHLSAVGLA